MALYDHITREVRTGPRGKTVGALFDLDQTIVAGFSAFAMMQKRLVAGRMSPWELLQTLATSISFGLGRTGFSGLMTATAELFRGVSESSLEEFGEEVFEEHLAADIYPESRELIRAHQDRGHTVAIVSSATRYQVEPIARALEIPHVLCTRLNVENGTLSGGVVRPVCYGQGKLIAAKGLAKETGIRLPRSYFYTDSYHDLPLLEGVGYPRPLNPDRRLSAVATDRGWPIRRFRSRGTPGVEEVARTGLAMASLVPATMAGASSLLLNGSRREAVNMMMSAWGELGTAASGIDVNVTGEQHLWSHRPAVFIFNHQSGIDALLICKLLRRDVVAVAKKELQLNPVFGPLFTFADTVFLDRLNRKRAIEALKPAVAALEHGLSLAIAPEGTRSSTTHVGSFKKGPFHIAMQAKVPIVPMVFRNALDALPKHARIVRPATIEVVVHPPVDTRRWTAANLDARIESVRKLFVETLEH